MSVSAADARPGPPSPAGSPAVEPPPAGVTPSPTVLHTVVEGTCDHLGVSFVGSETYLHGRSWIGKLDDRAAVVERLDTQPRDGRDIVDRGVVGLYGRAGGPLLALSERGIRGGEYPHQVLSLRTENATWEPSTIFGTSGNIREVFSWHDDSVLVLGERLLGLPDDEVPTWREDAKGYVVRLGVVTGRPKAPHLSRWSKGGARCPVEVWAMDATERGDVVAVVGCRERSSAQGTWVMRWFSDDLEGSIHKLSDRSLRTGRVAIGPQGATWVALQDDAGYELFARDGDAWKAVDSPPGALRMLALDRRERLWLATEQAIVRRSSSGWEPVGPPEVERVWTFAGVEHDTPWVAADDKLWSRTTEGQWVATPKPAPTWVPEEGPLSTFEVQVPRPGEVWVRAHYQSPWPKKVQGKMIERAVGTAALLSNRGSAPTLRCGAAIEPGHPPIDLRPWPRGSDERCGSRLLMLMRVGRLGGVTGYHGLRKLLRKHEDLAGIEIVELRGAGTHVVAARIETEQQQRELTDGVRAYRSKYSKPELACGDANALDATGFEVVQAMRLADDGRAFIAVGQD